ncbi:MAG: hypothetical protein ACHQK9_03680 [Reyranellales bacterium]
MTNNEFYYLVLVCGAFALFGVGTAISYARYRRWENQQAQVKAHRRS